MKSITIKMDTDNAAFEPIPELEIASILHSLADLFEDGRVTDGSPLFDINGNRVGLVKIKS